MREEELREYEKQARGDAKWEYDVLELVDEIRVPESFGRQTLRGPGGCATRI